VDLAYTHHLLLLNFGFDVLGVFCLIYLWWDTRSLQSRLTEIQTKLLQLEGCLSPGKLVGWYPTPAALQREESSPASFEGVLRRDRAIVGTTLIILTSLAWLYVLRLAAAMDMGGMDMTGTQVVSTGMKMVMASTRQPWSGAEFAVMFLIWSVMMVAMMLPSATQMVLIYARLGRVPGINREPLASTGWFAGGYLLVWIAFAFAATSAQWALERGGMLTPTMQSESGVIGGLLLIMAGLYQWSPLKDACLTYCQAPLLFIQRCGGFRADWLGAIKIGVQHGVYCVGCCWALMTLLFVGGVMNVLWIAAIAALVLVEKAISGRLVSRAAGAGLIIAAVCLLVASASFPLDSRSSMMPEPTIVARSIQ
jgi:predicted metal-binding membrane protein